MKDLITKAKKGDITILSDPHITKSGAWGRTALHYLAYKGKIEVLNHPDVAKVLDIQYILE